MLRANGTIAEQIVEKVANTADTDVLDQPPLYDVIDPDALDALVEAMSDGEVSFIYAGYEVTVESDRTVTLDELRSGYQTVGTPVSDD
ncbi:MAG: HalOD1 output domain-containing protein [Halolamina sp.]|uniref:HalOD1 output domain-containing protein n=1 Tax=Halolamina sp. TaxID=1940283 RepID=UPI002FC33421